MEVKALRTFTVSTETGMKVFNKNDIGELPDSIAVRYIESGRAQPSGDLPQLDHDGDGQPGGSVTAQGDDLPALRARYKELAGKNPFNGWDAEELTKRIAEIDHDGDGESGQSDEAPVS